MGVVSLIMGYWWWAAGTAADIALADHLAPREIDVAKLKRRLEADWAPWFAPART